MAEKPDKEKFTGCVLAGGKSLRMGRDKAFLEFGETTFLENAVEILKPNCETVKIVLNKSQTAFLEKLPAGIPHIFDIFQNRGAPAGIHAALNDCETEFAVILAVDLPFVTQENIRKLCEIAQSEKNFSAFVPRQANKKLQPLCAVYRAEKCLPEIEMLLRNTESASVRDFLLKIDVKIIESEILSGDARLFSNINAPEDYGTLIPKA